METLRLVLGDLRLLVPPPLSEIVLVGVSILCGAVVGVERERADKPAGLRTLILICLGSTLFTLASMSPAFTGADRSRIAAQIVTGVGFLGAGAILRERRNIVGLTTAASIWVIAAVGIVVGAGYAVAGLALSVAILATLSLLSRVEHRLFDRCRLGVLRIVYRPEGGKARARIRGALDEAGGPVALRAERTLPDGRQEIEAAYCPVHRGHRAVVADLAALDAVEELVEGPPEEERG